MITLAEDCLIFQLAGGEKVPFSSDMISIELMGESAQWFDADFVRDAAKAVFHYFKYERGRETITIGEFAEALEQVLGGFAGARPKSQPDSLAGVVESDLLRLARESGEGCELLFFPRLRQVVRQQVRKSPRVLRFSGLRSCVKELLGAHRWCARCRTLEDQIVEYLRECLNAEARSRPCGLVVG